MVYHLPFSLDEAPITPVMSTANFRHYYPKDVDFISITSTNITASDLPGPGRVLGNVLSNLGRRLEQALGCLAARNGYGPQNVASRIQKLDYACWRWEGDERVFRYSNDDAKRQRKDIKRLIGYAR